jgi:phytoene dehydrogenase-like protein
MRAVGSTREEDWDVVVVGGGIGGLAAAAYVARAGKRTLLLEARDGFSGRAESMTLGAGISAPVAAEAFYALDQKLIRDLHLHKFGLRFARRAMPVTALRPDGRHLTLPHELYRAREAIAAEGAADAAAYPVFRRELFALSRRLRSLWVPRGDSAQWRKPFGSVAAIAKELALSGALHERLDIAAHSSANTYLRNWFESDTLITALAFDTMLDGVGPDEPSSALLLVWRAAQKYADVQGGGGQVVGGPVILANAIADAARDAGAVLRDGAQVTGIEVEDGRVCGLLLDNDSRVGSKIIISSLCARQTFEELLLPDVRPFGSLRHIDRPDHFSNAKGLFALRGLPPFAGLSERELRGRLIIAEHSDAAGQSKRAALSGLLPSDLVMEVTVPSVADPTLSTKGVHVLSVNMPFLPVGPQGGWAANAHLLKEKILSALEVYAPGLGDRIINGLVVTPDDFRARYGADYSYINFYERLLRSYGESVRTPINGLYLCGVDAEPVNAITGRAGRVAALLALAEEIGGGNSRHE